MASGYITGSTNLGSQMGARIYWTATADRATNSSTLQVQFQLNNQYLQGYSMAGTWTLQVGSTEWTESHTVSPAYGGGWVTVWSRSGIRVDHDADGAKKIFIKVTGGCTSGYTKTNGCYQQVDLDTIIPLCSVGSLTPRELTVGSQMAITIVRPAGAQYARMWMSLGSAEDWITMDGTGTSYTWTLPPGWSAQLGGQQRLWATARLYTYSDSAHTNEVGHNDSIWYANAAAPSAPTVRPGWLKLYPVYSAGDTVPSGWDAQVYPEPSSGLPGVVLAGRCGIRAVIDASYIYQGEHTATLNISGCGIAVGGTRYPAASSSGVISARTGMIPAAGALSVTAYIATADGGTYQAAVTVDVAQYSLPALYGVSVYRCDSSGDPDDEGVRIRLAASVACTEIPDGEGGDRNTSSLEYRIRTHNGTWPAWTAFTSPAVIGDGSSVVFSETAAYDVEIRASDRVGNASFAQIVPGISVFMNALDNNGGVAFGKMAGQDTPGNIDSAWGIHTDGDMSVDGDLTVGGTVTAAGGFGLEIRTGTVGLIGPGTVTETFSSPMSGSPVILISNRQVQLVDITPTQDSGTGKYTGFSVQGAYGSAGTETVPYIALYWGGGQ